MRTAVLGALALTACGPGQVSVSAFEVSSTSLSAQDRGALERALRDRAGAASFVSLCAPTDQACRKGAWRLGARFELVPDRLPGMFGHLLVLQLRRGADEEPVAVQVTKAGDGRPLHQAFPGLVDDGMRVLGQRWKLRRAALPALLGELPQSSGERRFWLVDELAGRADPAATPALIEVVRVERDEATVLRAIGALLAARAPDLGPALIDATHKRSPAFVRQVIQVMAGFPSESTRGFLTTMAAGHADDEVRAAAQRALTRFEGEHP